MTVAGKFTPRWPHESALNAICAPHRSSLKAQAWPSVHWDQYFMQPPKRFISCRHGNFLRELRLVFCSSSLGPVIRLFPLSRFHFLALLLSQPIITNFMSLLWILPSRLLFKGKKASVSIKAVTFHSLTASFSSGTQLNRIPFTVFGAQLPGSLGHRGPGQHCQECPNYPWTPGLSHRKSLCEGFWPSVSVTIYFIWLTN